MLQKQVCAAPAANPLEPVCEFSKANAAATSFALGLGQGTPTANFKAYFTKAWFQRFAKKKFNVAPDMWDELTAKQFFLPADKKAAPDCFIPTIPCKHKLEDMFTVSNEPEFITLQENLNAARL